MTSLTYENVSSFKKRQQGQGMHGDGSRVDGVKRSSDAQGFHALQQWQETQCGQDCCLLPPSVQLQPTRVLSASHGDPLEVLLIIAICLPLRNLSRRT
eukprot:1161904-Pelagomonas_calceolata.AAC.9